MAVPILGLTGGIATGKSTVSRIFKNLGITIVDADLIARDIVAPNSLALIEITKRYGKQILLDNGKLNRAKLRQIIFKNESDKSWLNNLLHPIIRQEIIKQLNEAKGPYVILDAPLLLENALDQLCIKTIVVDIPTEQQVERAASRDDVTKEQIIKIIESQMPRADKLKKADIIIDNSGSLDNTQSQILAIHKSLLAT
ncbi:dephospho-CoA kinase [Pseudoalteromonas sp.]|uniref:dephospho-CoA kinase n=1 Tax=Pseudoalteromonas sp. TaxID=53249 RepID=UPI003568358F